MRSCRIETGVKLCFSRWNRKGYAIFASLGQEVRIGRLAIHICEMSLRKASRKGVIVELGEVFGCLVMEFEEYAEKVMRACRFAVRVTCDVNGLERWFKTKYKEKVRLFINGGTFFNLSVRGIHTRGPVGSESWILQVK